MSLFTVFAILISLTALFSFTNDRYIKLPTSIGVMIASLTSSILLIVLGFFGFRSTDWAKVLVEQVDFNALLMKGMLSYLIFAGALRVNLHDLLKHKWSITYLITLGMAFSTFLTGIAVWWVFSLIGNTIPFIYALLLGALISPTDTVAVLGILKRSKAGKSLQTIITGEALFNDATAVVIFIAIVSAGIAGIPLKGFHLGEFFIKEAIGGVLLGVILGYLSYKLINRVENYIVVVLITLAVVSGGYALADAIEISGPLTMVIAGLFLSHRSKDYKHPEQTRQQVANFWEIIDEILNAVLFVLIGLEILILHIEGEYILAGIVAIPIIIFTRFIIVGLPMLLITFLKRLSPLKSVILTWGGLRGGVSIALALSLPDSTERDLILVVSYIVVVFSILFQGLTLERLALWSESRS